ncbi:polycomb group RING finger protein 6 isoform X4 [Antennarius striatus]|uniref:polycomb group RING finger protein 6 isoform X4 n=1 Tax=Antennarius striatus TaxID=241820 RepID=UPI0035B48F63
MSLPPAGTGARGQDGSEGESEEEEALALQRFLPYIRCGLCFGFLIDASTITECLHTCPTDSCRTSSTRWSPTWRRWRDDAWWTSTGGGGWRSHIQWWHPPQAQRSSGGRRRTAGPRLCSRSLLSWTCLCCCSLLASGASVRPGVGGGHRQTRGALHQEEDGAEPLLSGGRGVWGPPPGPVPVPEGRPELGGGGRCAGRPVGAALRSGAAPPRRTG